MRERAYRLFSYLTQPSSKDRDHARREFILNVLLLSLITLCSIASIWTLIGELTANVSQKNGFEGTSLQVLFILGFLIISYLFARKKKPRWVAYLLIILLFTSTTQSISRWGVDLPQGLLSYSLIIVMAGILISSRFSIVITGLSILSIIGLMYAHSNHYLPLNVSWQSKPATLGDATVFSITLAVIAAVSWLFNHEMEAALKRARQSELALQRERDQLEITVAKRTQELQQAQFEKLAQLYHFSEFGRSASGLFHDLMTPLNLVSLNLESLDTHNKERNMNMANVQKYVNRAIYGTRKLESFIMIARKQFKNSEQVQKFSVTQEIEQVIKLVSYRAKELHAKIFLLPKSSTFVYGKVIRFDQMMINLINNALDALESTSHTTDKYINISINQKKGFINLMIEDNGKGISPTNLPKIFDPSFSTKKSKEHMGLGLYISKSIIEKDFKGSISVESTENKGTIFSLTFPQIKKV